MCGTASEPLTLANGVTLRVSLSLSTTRCEAEVGNAKPLAAVDALWSVRLTCWPPACTSRVNFIMAKSKPGTELTKVLELGHSVSDSGAVGEVVAQAARSVIHCATWWHPSA
jgi:hypothetical protein